MYNLPQEIEVWYVIPSIRKEISKILLKDYKMKYDEIAKLIGVTKSAVSQYLSGKRGEINLNKEVKNKIKKITKELVEGKKKFIEVVAEVINFMKKKKYFCDVCKKYNKEIIKVCEMKPIKIYNI